MKKHVYNIRFWFKHNIYKAKHNGKTEKLKYYWPRKDIIREIFSSFMKKGKKNKQNKQKMVLF